MSSSIVLDNENGTVWYHDEGGGIVHHHIKKWVWGDALRALLEAGTKAMRDHGAKKWLSDDRLNGVLKPADEEWAKTVWFPKTLQAGWKHWAVVLPEKVVGQMNMKRFAEDYAKAGINASLFSDPEAAQTWLAKLF